jgi:putative salt-induced outer membrane protein YdiY
MLFRFIPVVMILIAAAVSEASEVRLRDGSVVVGEILNLVNGEDLIIDTEHMDKVTIEWEAIESVKDTKPVVVELFNGVRLTGPMYLNDEGVRIGSPAAEPIDSSSIFAIEQVNQAVWDGLAAYTDVGWNIVRGNNTVTQLSFGAGIGYDGPVFETKVDATAIVNEQTDAEDTRRETVSASYTYLFHQTWSVTGLYNFEADEQQGLQARQLYGATIGNRVINNRRFRISLNGGLVVNSEDFDLEPREESLEAILASSVRWRSKNDIDLDATLAILPSLEQTGRVRATFDIAMSVDLFRDLDLKLTGYSRYDSDPPLGNATNDYGTTLGLSWEWD